MTDPPLSFLSLLPPLVAIALAISTRRVLLSLSMGLLMGALLQASFDPLGALSALLGTYIAGALSDRDHISIVVFSLLLGSMVGVIRSSGASTALAARVTRRIQSPRGGLLVTWALGVAIFFDDYVNALLVGSTMRPITDRLRVSREKLAFVVDATSATVASLVVVSSWIGVELGYIGDQFRALDIDVPVFSAFLASIPYRFYPILMLAFVLMVILQGRDWGPMLRAEERAKSAPDPGVETAQRDEAAQAEAAPRAWLAAAPVLLVMGVAVVCMLVTGSLRSQAAGVAEPTIQDMFSHADAVVSLLWAATSGSALAVLLVLTTGSLSAKATAGAWLAGVQSMLLAMAVLVLAWALGDVCRDLGTADTLVGLLGPALPSALVPALVFVLSAAIAFSTGTSWGTMAIVFPLAVPLIHGLEPGDYPLLLGTLSSILSGAVWGDHCSPISDTTILSAMSAGCDQVAHVRTQLPYALLVGVVSVVLCDVAVGFGLYPWWVALPLSLGVLFAVHRALGKRVDGNLQDAPASVTAGAR